MKHSKNIFQKVINKTSLTSVVALFAVVGFSGYSMAATPSADSENEKETYQLINMKRDSGIYNGTASKSDVLSVPTSKLTDKGKSEGVITQSEKTSEQAQSQGQSIAKAESKAPVDGVVYFSFDEATIESNSQESLDNIVDELKKGKVDKAEVVLKGYADAIGEEDYNMQLSLKRVKSVKDYLESQGVFAAVNWELEAMGEENPVASNDTAIGREKNRRVEIKIMPAMPEEQVSMQ